MLDTKLLKDNFEIIREKLLARHADGKTYKKLAELLDSFLALDEKRRMLITETEALQQDRNTFSKEIGMKKRAGEDADELQQKVQMIKRDLEISGAKLDEIQKKLSSFALQIPNIPDESVPIGKGENDNVEVRKYGEPKKFDFEPKQHFELAEALGILDLERAAKLAGSRFSLLRGLGARLERALVDFMLDIQTGENNYTEFAPPYIVNANAMQGTGQLPNLRKIFSVCREKTRCISFPRQKFRLQIFMPVKFLRKKIYRNYIQLTPLASEVKQVLMEKIREVFYAFISSIK